MKRLLCCIFSVILVLTLASCEPKTIELIDPTSSKTKAKFGYLWGLISNLPENFPELSEYVTVASLEVSTGEVHIEWCTASESFTNEVVEKVQQWAVTFAETQNYEDDNVTCYFMSKQLADKVADIGIYYFPDNTGEYNAEENVWDSQLVLEITYSETSDMDDTYQLAMGYNADDYNILHSYKFSGSLCTGISIMIKFNSEEAFNEMKENITNKYLKEYPSSTVEERDNSIIIKNEADIINEQLSKSDIIVEMQKQGFSQSH